MARLSLLFFPSLLITNLSVHSSYPSCLEEPAPPAGSPSPISTTTSGNSMPTPATRLSSYNRSASSPAPSAAAPSTPTTACAPIRPRCTASAAPTTPRSAAPEPFPHNDTPHGPRILPATQSHRRARASPPPPRALAPSGPPPRRCKQLPVSINGNEEHRSNRPPPTSRDRRRRRARPRPSSPRNPRRQ